MSFPAADGSRTHRYQAKISARREADARSEAGSPPAQRRGDGDRPERGGEMPGTALASQWHIDELGLADYLHRLGCADLAGPSAAPAGTTGLTPQQPTVTPEVPSVTPKEPATAAERLRRLHRAHVGALAFGNLDVVLGRSPSLDLAAIEDKLVVRRRGGYCFEQNLLFGAALERLGFTVFRLGARVQMGTLDLRPRTHMTLVVEADGAPWLADVGFGGEGLLDPVPLRPGVVVDQDGWGFRLDRFDVPLGISRVGDGRDADDGGGGAGRDHLAGWMLRALHHDGPFDLYSFTTEPWLFVDYVVANHYVATHPASPFVRQLVMQQTGATRHTLIGSALLATTPDGGADYTEVTPGEIPDVLHEVFGIDVADDADLVVAAASL